MLDMLRKAAEAALPSHDNDQRNFWLGCIGIRDDGAIVSAKNGAVESSVTVEHYQLIPSAHAEGRLLRKLGHNGIIYVARVSRQDRSYKMSAPCPMCATRIKSFGVRKVYYTINNNQYGVWDVRKDTHRVFDI